MLVGRVGDKALNHACDAVLRFESDDGAFAGFAFNDSGLGLSHRVDQVVRLLVCLDFGFATHQILVDEREAFVDKACCGHALCVAFLHTSLVVEAHECGENVAATLHIVVHHVHIHDVGFLRLQVHSHVFLEL